MQKFQVNNFGNFISVKRCWKDYLVFYL